MEKPIHLISNGNQKLGFITLERFNELNEQGRIVLYQNDLNLPMIWSVTDGCYLSLTKLQNIKL
jgi:hypothetical protein